MLNKKGAIFAKFKPNLNCLVISGQSTKSKEMMKQDWITFSFYSLLRMKFSFFILILTVSCNLKESSPKINQDKTLNRPDSIPLLRKECIPKYLEKESRKFHIKYVDKGTYFDVELRIDSVSKLLGYQFDCSAPHVIIPRFSSFLDDYICLERGCGQNCVVYFVFKKIGGNIVEVGNYYHALGIDLKFGVCVYINENNVDELIINDFKTSRIDAINLGTDTIGEIIGVKIDRSGVILKFDDSSSKRFFF